jgi:hypothetical protein
MNEPNSDNERIATTLLASYRDSAHAFYPRPPTARVVARARQRTRRRVAVTAAGLAAAFGGAILFALQAPEQPPVGGRETGEPSPGVTSTPSVSTESTPPAPSGSASSRPPSATAIDITTVNWRNTTIQLPATRDDPDCPTGRITTRGEDTEVGRTTVGIMLEPAYGDLTGDGRPDAVLYVACRITNAGEQHETGQLMVVTEQGGQLVGLGYVGPLDQVYLSWKVTNRKLVATIDQVLADTAPQERTYSWNGTRFVQVAGPTTFPSQ